MNMLKRCLLITSLVTLLLSGRAIAQDDANNTSDQTATDQAASENVLDAGEGGFVILRNAISKPKLPVIFSGSVDAKVTVKSDSVAQQITLQAKVIQGQAKTLTFGIAGQGLVTNVTGKGLTSWAVRKAGKSRFLDLHVSEDVKDLQAIIQVNSNDLSLPAQRELTHLTAGDSIGFAAVISIQHDAQVVAKIAKADGFVPLDGQNGIQRLQTNQGGQIVLQLSRSNGAPAPVEITNSTLIGTLHPNGKSIEFKLRGNAIVSQDDATLKVLSGNAALSKSPSVAGTRLQLVSTGKQTLYQMHFDKPGQYPLELDFVAKLDEHQDWRHMDFTVAASAVVPIALKGIEPSIEFQASKDTIVPNRQGEDWVGFLPASGRALVRWKQSREESSGKLFFTSSGFTETKIGAGLLRQAHRVSYQILQGELSRIDMTIAGPGEILEVQGANIISWKVLPADDQADPTTSRTLQIVLSQPINAKADFVIQTQTALGAFPIEAKAMRLTPVDAVRHSGYVRLSNLGSVRLEPTEISGLTQLAPEQFPAEAIEARQVFAYRFPTSEYNYGVLADRVQPEVSVSQISVYRLTETEQSLQADIELDIREAPIREWDVHIPDDHTVVSATGANVADYIVASEIDAGQNVRNLKIVFRGDVSGRQLVRLVLEKTQNAATGGWQLRPIQFPETKSVRGDIGVAADPGYRLTTGTTDHLAEKSLASFPTPTQNLQQAFRIRQADWSATMQVEQLERSVQSDVFHLYSLSQETVYGSALINYFVTGAPVSQWKLTVPQSLGNVNVDGQDVRTWRREEDTLIVTLHQPVMGAFTLLVTFEENPGEGGGTFQAGLITPQEVQNERGYIQVVSPMQVELEAQTVSDGMLVLDPLELPAELRLLSTAPALGTWQYTERPFNLSLNVRWFQPGTTAAQIVEFSEVNSDVTKDGQLATEITYYVKSLGGRSLKVKLPADPVRLWDVSVDGKPVNARQTKDATLIPLPGGDPNRPIPVTLRISKPAVKSTQPVLSLPVVFAPVLKTQWRIHSDKHQVLVPVSKEIAPPKPVLAETGFQWIVKQGIWLLIRIGFFVALATWLLRRSAVYKVFGIAAGIAAFAVAITATDVAMNHGSQIQQLELNLPVLSSGEAVEVAVNNLPTWMVQVSWPGVGLAVAAIILLLASYRLKSQPKRPAVQQFAVCLLAVATLLQPNGAPGLFVLIAAWLVAYLIAPQLWAFAKFVWPWGREGWKNFRKKRAAVKAAKQEARSDVVSKTATTGVLLLAILFSNASQAGAEVPAGFVAADSINQQWQIQHQENRLTATGQVSIAGRPGDRFLLLKAPATLTRFEGQGLRLSKQVIPQLGMAYVISIPVPENQPAGEPAMADYQAEFDFQLEDIQHRQGIAVLTGPAALRKIDVQLDQADWEISCNTAVRVEPSAGKDKTEATVLLGLGDATVTLKPMARDVTTEETQFFVESSNLFIPGPGVVDGTHQLNVRTSQGQVSSLNVMIPAGFMVSSVDGPIGAWQFDAEKQQLKVAIEPAQSGAFEVMIQTQRGLDTLPADVALSPVTVDQPDGQVGLVAVAFGPDAQPEKVYTNNLSAVNLSDFDARLLNGRKVAIHKVYRYGAEGGDLTARVVPVDAEVRLMSEQVLSIGDERVVLAVNFAAGISRAGLFQLSFPLPDGFEVESLTGASLSHWSEIDDNGGRRVIMHLNGKTIGAQSFSLTLTGTTAAEGGQWQVPRFELDQAERSSGKLIVRPTTGLRLRAVSRLNVTEIDPRSLGGQGQGAIAFNLLQSDWNLVLGIEKLDPWVIAQVLHEVTLREGQTRSTLMIDLDVQNASIRTFPITVPLADDAVLKTLRAAGEKVADMVRVSPDSNVWELQFKERIVGKTMVRIEYERRGQRANDTESLVPFVFPQARQLAYFFGVRTGGRLEIEAEALTQGWQQADWNAVPQALRASALRSAPMILLRAVNPAGALGVSVKRHSIADSLKLRVTEGRLTSVLSPTGDQLTAVDVTMEVMQRSSLSVGLPQGGELISIFVNGESVNSIRLGQNSNTWQFYVLPGLQDRTATVSFVYSVTGGDLKNLKLLSPELSVPLKDIQWDVIAPLGFELTDDDGNMELTGHPVRMSYDRQDYEQLVNSERQEKQANAVNMLRQAGQLLQQGDRSKANWVFNSVANQYALDAATNEDVRVQLENLQTEQAIVGLNSRRQRLFLDNSDDQSATLDQQWKQAATINPILQQNQVNFRPQQLSALLQGNSSADNQALLKIAARLVQHQHSTQPAPQAIRINMPEEGNVYTFRRSVQVAEKAPLEIEVDVQLERRLKTWQVAATVLLLAIMAVVMFVARKPAATTQTAGA